MKLTDFVQTDDMIAVSIKTRYIKATKKWSAGFIYNSKRLCTIDGLPLSQVIAVGNTSDLAVTALEARISGKQIVFANKTVNIPLFS